MQSHDDVEAAARDIGRRIRTVRNSKGITLTALAQATGLSEGFISKLERGQTSSSLANIISIAGALNIDTFELFADAVPSAKATEIEVHHRASDSAFSLVEGTGYKYRLLAGAQPLDTMEVFHLVFPEENAMKTLVSHPGQEHCFVLSGEIRFIVGKESHHLRAGDGIYINSGLPHRAENVGLGEAHVLMTVVRPTDQLKTSSNLVDWWRLPTEPGRDVRMAAGSK